MTSADFLPVRFAGGFETWSPEDLIYAVVSKRFGGDWWISVSWKDERADEVGVAGVEAQKQVLDAFRTGALRAYVHLVGTDLFYIIPANVWVAGKSEDGDDPEGVMAYLAGRLLRGDMFDTKAQRAIPEVFDGAAILIKEADAKDWLTGAKVGKARRGTPPIYDWPAFEAEAAGILRERGGISPLGYRKADLLVHMETWCTDTWGEGGSPGDTSIKNHVTKVIAQAGVTKGKK